MQPYYERAGVTIYHGDCRDVLPSLVSDVMVSDPPYGIAYATNYSIRGVGASWLGTSIANDDTSELRETVLKQWGGRPALIFGSWKTQPPIGTKTVLIWDKGPASGMGDLRLPWKASYEEIYVLGTGFTGRRDEGVLKGFNVVTWETAGRMHPNQKPESLMRYLLTKCSTEWQVLDPFMGSGTTLRAAMDLGRRAIGIEIDERYCEIAAKRLQQDVLPLDMTG